MPTVLAGDGDAGVRKVRNALELAWCEVLLAADGDAA